MTTTDTRSPEQRIDDLAPWPTSTDDVTADAYARYLTVTAYYHVAVDNPRLRKQWEAAGLPSTGPLRDAFVNSCAAASAEYGLVYLLREAGPTSLSADQLAQVVHLPYDGDVEEVESDLHEWLIEYGIDPQAVIDAAQPGGTS